MLIDLSHRSTREEHLDDPSIDAGVLAQTIDEVDRVNRLTAGHLATLYGFETLRPRGDQLQVLDVGCGNGALAVDIAEWARPHFDHVHIRGIDLNPAIIRHADRRHRDRADVSFACVDLFDLPDVQQYDIVHASLMLHHLPDALAAQALSRMAQLARVGVVIADLHRHIVPWLFTRATISRITSNPLVQHDAPLSVARAFTRADLASLAARANLLDHRIEWRPLFRWVLTAPALSHD